MESATVLYKRPAPARSHVLKVNFIKDDEGKPIYYTREGKNTALLTKIGSRHLVLEIYEDIRESPSRGESIMKLTDKLLNRIGNARSEDEIKTILAETKKDVESAGVILDDAELDKASGGFDINNWERPFNRK